MTQVTDETPPEHILPKNISDMTAEDHDKFLEQLRERRLKSVRVYEEAQAAAKMAADEKARVALEKQCTMAQSAADKIDTAITKLEARVQKIRVLRLELGLD